MEEKSAKEGTEQKEIVRKVQKKRTPPGELKTLSLCGPNSISRANAHMVYMGGKLSRHITLHYCTFFVSLT